MSYVKLQEWVRADRAGDPETVYRLPDGSEYPGTLYALVDDAPSDYIGLRATLERIARAHGDPTSVACAIVRVWGQLAAQYPPDGPDLDEIAQYQPVRFPQNGES
jgi:hypothetical protein